MEQSLLALVLVMAGAITACGVYIIRAKDKEIARLLESETAMRDKLELFIERHADRVGVPVSERKELRSSVRRDDGLIEYSDGELQLPDGRPASEGDLLEAQAARIAQQQIRDAEGFS